MHSAVKIANYFLSKAQEDKKDLTPLQLMKLVYLAHGWMLGAHGRHLVKEPIEAWQYGPVIPDLYHKTKKFRSTPVIFPIENTDLDFDNDEKGMLDQVYKLYSDWSGMKLSALTHLKDSPWDIVRQSKDHDPIISNDIIMDYYKDKYKKI